MCNNHRRLEIPFTDLNVTIRLRDQGTCLIMIQYRFLGRRLTLRHLLSTLSLLSRILSVPEVNEPYQNNIADVLKYVLFPIREA